MERRKKEIYITKSAKETQKLGQVLAKDITKKRFDFPIALALKGDLGSGKTTFLQGFAKGLGIKEKILSPTFVIVKRFEVKKRYFKNFYHIDCYRLKNKEDFVSLGFKDIIFESGNIIAVEWPEKIYKLLPPKVFLIEFKFIDENNRQIAFAKSLR